MIFHKYTGDKKDVGGRDKHTGRYIPHAGGSRSRIPFQDDKTIHHYWGFVGVDESMSGEINSVATLYAKIGGGIYIPEGPAGEYINKLLALSR